jgi:Na+/phosphate symporter
MSIYISLLVSLAGLIVYGLSANHKVQEMGRIAFGVGLLVFLLNFPRVVAVLGR